MSLNMYLGETDTQKNTMNAMCIDLIQAMEQVQSSVRSFTWNVSLRGQTYHSAKAYMNQVYMPLTQGIIYLCEELIRQNDQYPSDFRTDVSSSDVVEEEVQAQIDEINRIIQQLQEWNDSFSLFSMKIFIYEQMKRNLLQKLADLRSFNSTSSNKYEVAMQFAESVFEGLSQIQGGKGFSKASGTFSTDGMDMGWVADLTQTHYTRRAAEKFGDFIGEDSEKLAKVIEILKYEDANPDDAEKVTEFLLELEERDMMEIKYLIYTAEEPYRSLSMKYLDRFEIASTTSSGVFSPSKNTITFNVSEDREGSRGSYYTFFHEVGHAIDFYSENPSANFFVEKYNLIFPKYTTDEFEVNGQTLTEQMYEDAESHFKQEIAKELKSAKYNHLSVEQKQEMIINVTENLLEEDKLNKTLTEEERELNREMRRKYKGILHGPDHNTASDVYGGITNHFIEGNYNHQTEKGKPNDYWVKNGKRIREPNHEGFAEFFGRVMVPEGDSKDAGLESIEEFLPGSKEFMEEMAEDINER